MVPVPADIILGGEVPLGKTKGGFPAITAHLPHPLAREAGQPRGWPVRGMAPPRESGAAAATYFSNFVLRREDFGEELQVNLSIL